MNLREALSIPYIRGAETIFDEDRQRWLRRFDYAELDGCAVENDNTLDGLRELEIARVACIVELMEAGRPIPRSRAPLLSEDVNLLLERLDIAIDPNLLAIDDTEAAHSPAFRKLADDLAERAGRRVRPTRQVTS